MAKIGQLIVELVAKTSGFGLKFQAASKSLNQFQRRLYVLDRRLTRFNRNISRFGRGSRALGGNLRTNLTLPLLLLGGAAARSAYNFDKSMNVLRSLKLETPRKELEKLRKEALALAGIYPQTAGDVAAAQVELARGGLSPKTISGTLPSLLDLINATDFEPAEAAKLVVRMQTALKRPVSEMSADISKLLKTMASSPQNIRDFAEGFADAAPVIQGLGISIEKFLTLSAGLASIGIVGSKAGTALRRILVRPIQATPKTQEGLSRLGFTIGREQIDFYDLFRRLDEFRKEQGRTEGAKAIEQIFGVRGISGVAGLSQAVPLMKEFEATLRNLDPNYSQKVIKEMLAGFPGELTRAKSALDTFSISLLGESGAIDSLTRFLEKVQQVFNVLKGASPQFMKLVVNFGLVGAAAAPLLIALGSLTLIIQGLVSAFAKLALFLVAPGVLLRGITMLTAGFVALYSNADPAIKGIAGVAAAILVLDRALKALIGLTLVQSLRSINKRILLGLLGIGGIAASLADVEDLQNALRKLGKSFTGLGGADVKEKIGDDLKGIFDAVRSAMADVGSLAGKGILGADLLAKIQAAFDSTQKAMTHTAEKMKEDMGEAGDAIVSENEETTNAFIQEWEKTRLRLAEVARDSTDAFSDFYLTTIKNFKSIGDAARELGNIILNEVIRKLVAMPLATATTDLLGNWLSPGGGAVARSPGTGHPIPPHLQARSKGGRITGGSGVRDDVPAMLTGGEFVVRKSVAAKFGSFLQWLNQGGSIPGFARGGWVGAAPSGGGGSFAGIKVVVNNNAPGVNIRTRPGVSPAEVVVIAEEVVNSRLGAEIGGVDSQMNRQFGRATRPPRG